MQSGCNPYDKCPVYTTEHFILRLVEPGDAADLLECYSDSAAVELMNSDRCTSDFHYTTLTEMSGCIEYWLAEYRNSGYVRFSIVDAHNGKAVGTVEIFGGEYGVLRLDIKAEYERKNLLSELLQLSRERFHADFSTVHIITKAIPKAAERLAALRENGYQPDTRFRPDGHYYVHNSI